MRIKRWLARFAITIVLGVLTTVVIAWIFDYQYGRETSFRKEAWQYTASTATSPGRIDHYTWRTGHGLVIIIKASIERTSDVSEGKTPPFILRNHVRHLGENLNEDPDRTSAQVRASGWPMLALHRDIVFFIERTDTLADRRGNSRLNIQRRDIGMFQAQLPVIGEVRLALLPAWPGFGVDVALFAFGWLAFFLLIAWLRRGYRAHRGLCVACKYDLRGAEHERCPECGAMT